MTLAVEDKNQKLFDVVAFADVANEQIVDEVLVTADSWVTASQFRQQLDNFNVHLQLTIFCVKAQDQFFVACLYLVELLTL